MRTAHPGIILLVTTMVLLLAASPPARSRPPLRPTPPPSKRPIAAGRRTATSIHIVTLGDSITKGVRPGVTAGQTFASLTEAGLRTKRRDVRVTNVGIGGERTDQALKRLDRVLGLKPDIVTIMYGTNDSYVDRGKTASRLSLETYRANLVTLVTELLRRGITPVLMTEPRWADDAKPNGLGENPNEKLEPYIEACRKVAATWHVPLVDHFAHWSRARKDGANLRELTTDGCHPNPAGHLILAATMLPVLERALGPELAVRRKLDRADHPVRVVCFGDSVTGVYYHTGSRRAYTDMLKIALERACPRARVEAINAGISGNTTADGLKRIEKDVLAHRPDVVTVMFGLNDMTRVPIAAYRQNLLTIVEKCQAIGAEVILATPNNVIATARRPIARLVEYCDAVRRVGRELGLVVCDCNRELDAMRHHDADDWRLLMSDEIHPNMDGHKRIAEQLAGSICGRRVTLAEVGPPQPAIPRTLSLLRADKPIRVLAMPPYDGLIEGLLRKLKPGTRVEVTSWPVEGQPLKKIEQDAAKRVRAMKPDLVLIAVPRSAGAASAEEFIHSYSWIMNHSLSFSYQQWDCVIVHPSVADPGGGDADHDALVRRLVRAQDLHLVDRPKDSRTGSAKILEDWFGRQLMSESK